MSNYRYKAKIGDDLVDALDIIKNAGKSIVANHAEKNALIESLKAALLKIESAKYYLDRE